MSSTWSRSNGPGWDEIRPAPGEPTAATATADDQIERRTADCFGPLASNDDEASTSLLYSAEVTPGSTKVGSVSSDWSGRNTRISPLAAFACRSFHLIHIHSTHLSGSIRRRSP